MALSNTAQNTRKEPWKRASGILLHPTSLPGKGGVGTLGKSARDFIQFLSESRQTYWQVLPLGPTGYGNSPYQCFSAHAGNPNLIDLESLSLDGWLQPEELESAPDFSDHKVDFTAVEAYREPLLRKAFERFDATNDPTLRLRYRNFLKEHHGWIQDYSLFQALRNHFNRKPWYEWEPEIRDRDPAAIKQYNSLLKEEVDFHLFLQFIFFRQYLALLDFAHKRSIQIIGDIPIYVALDSADTWASPEVFSFDSDRQPTLVGGVPPDYFSVDGQRWGNPLYRWTEAKEAVYNWWEQRIRTNLQLFDIIRFDHFRGFAGYWAIPASEKTAVNGTWIKGPGSDFFKAMEERLGRLPFIAEDLGVITPDVIALRDEFDFPGMKILSFAFDSGEANNFLPYTYDRHCVVFTGTHDNDTARGWFDHASEADKRYALDYLGCEPEDVVWSMIRGALGSVAQTAIIPMQDLLELGSEDRMNIPGTTEGNWEWRTLPGTFSATLASRLSHNTKLYGRG